jgi:hypothetical protein
MGNIQSSAPKLEEAFKRDGHTIIQHVTHGKGFGIKAQAVTGNYIGYVRGSPYEMGFMMGRMFYPQLEKTCTTYLTHMVPQFISEDFDVAMQTAPLILSIIYENILNWLINILVTESVTAFDESVKRGDIPANFVEEIDGTIAGASSMRAFSQVTRARLVAANFGLDYLFSQILSGRIFTRLKKFLSQFPKLPIDSKKILAVPEMCNLVMVSKSATLSKNDAYMMRDFQFANGRVYHKNCMILIRDGRDHNRLLNACVTMPGWIGAITGLNQSGLACGMNMIRSEAVDTERIGCGIMIMNRTVLDTCKTLDEMETHVRSMVIGMPWILYGLDANGDQRVFELVGRNIPLNAERWKDRYDGPKELIASLKLDAKWNTGSNGVWPRTGFHHTNGDRELSEMNRKLFRSMHLPNPEFPIFKTFSDEYANPLGHSYFVLWHPQTDVTIATNAFLNPILRRTEMTPRMRALNTGTPSTTWRYGKLATMVENYHGKITLSECRTIVSFLNPKDEPKYSSNERKYNQYAQMVGSRYDDNEAIMISGSLSVIDINARRLENKSGNWQNEFFGITLTNYE